MELNVSQRSEAPVKRKSFSSNVTEFQRSHENKKLNFSSPTQPELLKLRSLLLMDKESLHTDLFVSRTSLLIERLTGSFWQNFSDVQPKNLYISPVSSPLPTGVVPLEPPQGEQVAPQVLFLQETFSPSYLISSLGVPFSTPTTDKISNKNHKKSTFQILFQRLTTLKRELMFFLMGSSSYLIVRLLLLVKKN